MSFGVTISLTEKNTEEIRTYLERMRALHAEEIFTTLRLPGNDMERFKESLKENGAYIKENFKVFAADVSRSVLEAFSLEELHSYGITTLRIDNGIPEEEIARLSKEFKIILNASTIDDAFLERLRQFGYEGSFEAWHNYYPRKNTGLDIAFFKARNRWMQERQVQVGAFIAGDAELRGTIFEGLPTIEVHRGYPPVLAYLEMKHVYDVDKIILGDFDLTEKSFHKMQKLLSENVLEIGVRDVQEESILEMVHHNRVDIAADAIRSNEYRRVNRKHIAASNTCERKKGAVTIDNDGYSRYMGELQIVLKTLPADQRVNVTAQVVEEDMDFLPYIKSFGYGFIFQKQ